MMRLRWGIVDDQAMGDYRWLLRLCGVHHHCADHAAGEVS
jgi:hypothetical protein